METQTVIRVFGYSTATIVFVVGIAVLFGLVLPAYVPEKFRTIVGVVLLLYGVYRAAMLWIKQHHGKRTEE